MQFKMYLVQKSLVEFKSFGKGKNKSKIWKLPLADLTWKAGFFLNQFELFQVILFAVNIIAVPVKGVCNSYTQW